MEEEVKEEVVGSFLEDSKVFRVSSLEGKGIDEVKAEIDKMSDEIEDRDLNDMPRLPVDRVFSISGFGTIVTGTLISGQFKVGEEVQIFPGDTVGRIRSLQVHDKDTDRALAGQRVAINISGIKTEEVDRGSVVAPLKSMKDTSVLDVKVRILESIDRIIENRTRVRLYIGSKEVLCRMVIIDREELNPGDEAYCQLLLEEPIVAKRGDKFIIRFYSPMFTIGGGHIIEPNPNRKKRFNESDIEEFKIKDKGDSKDVIEKIVLDSKINLLTIKDISVKTAMLEENVKKDIQALEEEGKLILLTLTKEVFLVHRDNYLDIKNDIMEELEVFHKKYPLRQGKSKEEVRSKYLSKTSPKAGEKFLDLLIMDGYVDQRLEYLSLKDFEIDYTPSQEAIREKILESYRLAGFEVIKREEAIKSATDDVDEGTDIFIALLSSGEIKRLDEDLYIDRSAYDKALDMMRDYLNKNEGINIGEFRDLLGTNRKMALGILESFDEEKLTKRSGDKRVLA